MPDQKSLFPLAIQSTKIFSKAPIAFKISTARNPLVAAIAFIKSCLFMVLIVRFYDSSREKSPLVVGRGQRKNSGSSPQHMLHYASNTRMLLRFNPARPVCSTVVLPNDFLHIHILSSIFPRSNFHRKLNGAA